MIQDMMSKKLEKIIKDAISLRGYLHLYNLKDMQREDHSFIFQTRSYRPDKPPTFTEEQKQKFAKTAHLYSY